ncbi:hypothetical protein [Streptomyces sp. NPDC013171]|uniref:hypothetical protein n=1 Tax=Streptomyces sp. NPDC013171 TaxID=3364863 RepID=UPI00367EFA39
MTLWGWLAVGWPLASIVTTAAYSLARTRQKRCPISDAQIEIDQLNAQYALPAARWRCAHCGDRITGADVAWTGPVPEPGEDPDATPRFHIDRPECREAADVETDARRGRR